VLTSSYVNLLKKKGFAFYLVGEFLGVINDNILRMTLGLMALTFGVDKATPDAVSAMGVSLVGAVFIIPFLVFSGIAGSLADRYNKRIVLIVTKSLEVATMLLALAILPLGIFWLNLVLLFLLATQAAFFSPAKYGFLPEIFTEQQLSRANGIVEMTTYTGIVLGLFLGGLLYSHLADQQLAMAYILLLVSVVGTICMFGSPRTSYPGVKQSVSFNPWSTIITGSRKIYSNTMLVLTVSGIAWFWFLGSLLNSLILLLGQEVMHLDSYWIGVLLIQLGVGVAIGSLLAGRLSGDHVEVGLVPLGAIGLGLGSILLYFLTPNFYGTVLSLLVIGMSGGLFIVPLNANLQHLAGIQEKGRLIATTNVYSMTAVLMASAVLPVLHDFIGLRSDVIILLIGFITVCGTALAAQSLPMILLRCGLWVITHTLYRISVRGAHNLPSKGAALLVCNHVSYVDGFLVGGAMKRHVQFMLFDKIYHIKFLEPFFKLMKVIPVYRGKNVRKTFEMARAGLERGELVCIFAEGALTRNGLVLPFRKGLEKVTEGLSVPIIPVSLDNAWGSVFSYEHGKFFFKAPKSFPYPVTVTFGSPLPPNTPKEVVRQAVKELEVESFSMRKTVNDLLPIRFLKSAKSVFWRFCMADSTGIELRYGQVLLGSIALARKIKKLTSNEEMVGILMPSSVGGAMANLAVSLTGKIPVNLNFTVGEEAYSSALEQCKINKIITSSQFIQKIGKEKTDQMIFLEDLRESLQFKDKIFAFLTALLPSRLIFESICNREIKPKSLATVLFSSGSTGIPKGVMLSHKNILSNIEGIGQIIPQQETNRFMAILPFFHSFGYTVLLWFPLIKKMSVVYHPNPLEAKTIGNLVSKYQASFMVATSSFYYNYTRNCEANDFKSLKFVVAGAEKLRPSVAEDFRNKFGLDIFEGYGCTELSPVVSVNVPDVLASDGSCQIGAKPGTIGTSLPGIATKIVDPETMEDLPLGESGMLLVKGNSNMIGYLNQPLLTSEAFYGSWYITGDIAKMDDAGFITMVDRLSRFSKIGGEMVPHVAVEDKANEILGGAHSVVVSMGSDRKGESLAVLYTHESVNERQLWEELKLSGLPKLWLPKPDAILRIQEIPVLANGKVNLRAAKELAMAKFAA
jgi:acyl-[acyl-carrier-protein]-phospholipid O-acyltransferase / long-chain-fatty-acid--[acyl-carrier-protein] ligase